MYYDKTDAGKQAFRERSALFSAHQRAAFILFDGLKSLDQVLASTASLGITRPDIEQLVTHGFLKDKAVPGPSEVAVAALPVTPMPPALPPPTGTAPTGTTPTGTAPITPAQVLDAPAPPQAAEAVTLRAPQERYSLAKPIATQLTASLGLRGFMLNLGVEAASGYDDLLALFPKIQAAVGAKKCEALERALKG